MRFRPSPSRLVLLFPVMLAACQTPPRMAAPADLADADVLEVSNRSSATGALVDESFNVGPYQVRKVKRGWKTTNGYDVGGYEQARSHQGFQFRFIGKEEWEGRCELNARDQAAGSKRVILFADSHALLDCSCTAGRQSAALKLDDKLYPVQGNMTLGGEARYGLRPEGLSSNLRMPILGYRVEGDAGHAVAAAELQYPGRIWQRRDLPAEQREPQACLLGALMIHALGSK